MLDIYIKQGLCFSDFKNILLYMKEENLNEIEITNVEYVFDNIPGNGVYTLDQIKSIVDDVKSA